MHPNFLIIGPPKCASTSLHYYLGQHPEIYVSEVKETNFFTHDYNKGIQFYEKYFKDAGAAKAIGEATPSYSFLPFAAGRIKENYPDIKLILCFRNPMERAFSNWLMLWDAGVEKASFKDAININLKQLGHANFEGESGARLWDDRRYMSADDGEKWIRTYIQPGMYAEILKNYLKHFDAGQVKYYILENFKAGFDKSMQEIFSFLNVNDSFIIPQKEEKNFYYNRKLFRILNNIIGREYSKKLVKYIPGNIKNIFKAKKQNVKAVPVLNDEDRLFLYNIYKNDIAELQNITGEDLSFWMPK